MNYADFEKLQKTIKKLPYNQRNRSFSEGVSIIAKNIYCDFPNLHVRKQVNILDEEYNLILYGNYQEVFDSITFSDASRLVELGWFIESGLDEDDNYFKFRL